MTPDHRIRWWAVAGDERLPRNRHMRDGGWGWDATCSCGWDSRTGGAIAARVAEAVADHKSAVAFAAEHTGQHADCPPCRLAARGRLLDALS